MLSPLPSWTRRALTLVFALWLCLLPSLALAQDVNPAQQTGNYYVVQRGDTWARIAYRYGVTIAQLRAANPRLVRPGDVLWVGDRMLIPGAAAPAAPKPQATAATNGYWYTVRSGDSWQIVARDTGVSVLELWHANPTLLNRNRWLYVGTRVWIPGRATANTATAVPTATATSVPPATATPIPSPIPPATATPIPSPVPTSTASPVPTSAPVIATAEPLTATVPSNCPSQLGEYAGAIATYLNGPEATIDGLQSWLARCGVTDGGPNSVITAGIHDPTAEDVVITVHPQAASGAGTGDQDKVPAGLLLVYHQMQSGYGLTGIAQGLGGVSVLQVADINDDGKVDIIWTDTTCDEDSCSSTLFVDSWDGTAYRSWLVDQPTTAGAEYRLEPVPDSKALAIVIGSQHAEGKTVTYVSKNGAPYAPEEPAAAGLQPPATATSTMSVASGASGGSTPAAPATPTAQFTEAPRATPRPEATPTQPEATPKPSATSQPTATAQPEATAQPAATIEAKDTVQPEATPTTVQQGACLLDEVLGANRAFDSWTSTGFGPAIQAYQAAIDDTRARACGEVKDELALLRDFARLRIVVALVSSGKSSQVPAIQEKITVPALKGAVDAFMNSYRDSHSVIQACRDTSDYATGHPDSWQFMVDLGQTKFTPEDLCPLAK